MASSSSLQKEVADPRRLFTWSDIEWREEGSALRAVILIISSSYGRRTNK
jgi:hypothetical protein